MIYRFVMQICLILSLPVLAACSNSGATPDIIATDTQIAATSTTAPTQDTSSIIPELSETYTGENPLVNAVLTVNYPRGWTIQGSGTQLLLASADPETIDNDRDALLINITPIAPEMLQGFEDASAESLVAQAMLDTIGQEVEVTATTINNRDAAYASAQLDQNATLVYALQVESDVFIVLTAIKVQDFTSDDEALIMAIAVSIQYDAGEIPQSE